jgi:hypothetical protein
MRAIRFLVSTVITTLLLAHPMARGQVSGSEGLYCNAGLHPDGYVDFSGLPPAPTGMSTAGVPSESTTSPVTATLPVKGVPGLTVTISIPSLQVQAGAPAYFVNGAQLQFNNLVEFNASPETLLTLSFNQPVYGVGLNMGNGSGRFLYSYNLQVGDASQSVPAPFSNTASGYTLDPLNPRSVNLQVVGLTTTFSTAAVQFIGDPGEGFGSPIFSNIRIQSSSAPDPADSVPRDGLQQWLRMENVTSYLFFLPGSGTWTDQSGNGHDATPTPGHAPTLVADGRTCLGAWQFNGSSSFDFNLPISGWSEMTVFLVARSTKDPPAGSGESSSAAILWTENAYWGNTFVSPYQTHIDARFGATRPNTNLDYVRPGAGIGGDFTITRAVHDHETDSLYVNGLEVLSQRGNDPVLGGVTGDGTIGQGINGTYYDGEISEILVYNRVLSVQEAAQVESYLRNKFGIE